MQKVLVFLFFIVSVSCGVGHKCTVEVSGPGCVRICLNQLKPPSAFYQF